MNSAPASAFPPQGTSPFPPRCHTLWTQLETRGSVCHLRSLHKSGTPSEAGRCCRGPIENVFDPLWTSSWKLSCLPRGIEMFGHAQAQSWPPLLLLSLLVLPSWAALLQASPAINAQTSLGEGFAIGVHLACVSTKGRHQGFWRCVGCAKQVAGLGMSVCSWLEGTQGCRGLWASCFAPIL